MKYTPKLVFAQYEYGTYLISGPGLGGKWAVCENRNGGKIWQTKFKTRKEAIIAIDREEAPAVELEPSIQ